MERKPKKIGELLIESGLINREQLEGALEEQKVTGDFLGAILIRRGDITEDGFISALSDQYNLPCVCIRYDYVDWDFLGKFSPELILYHKCFPLKADDFTVTVAITNPLDVWAIRKVEEETRGYNVKYVLVSMSDMAGAIKRYKEEFQVRDI